MSEPLADDLRATRDANRTLARLCMSQYRRILALRADIAAADARADRADDALAEKDVEIRRLRTALRVLDSLALELADTYNYHDDGWDNDPPQVCHCAICQQLCPAIMAALQMAPTGKEGKS